MSSLLINTLPITNLNVKFEDNLKNISDPFINKVKSGLSFTNLQAMELNNLYLEKVWNEFNFDNQKIKATATKLKTKKIMDLYDLLIIYLNKLITFD